MKIFLTTAYLLFTAICYGQSYEHQISSFQSELVAFYKNKETSPLANKERRKFKTFPFFKVDSSYKVHAKLEFLSDKVKVKMKTSTDRVPEYDIYAKATFKLHGETYTLHIYQNPNPKSGYENHLFLPFTDLTNAVSTYAGGRYIDLTIPSGDSITIDFNKSYNPYCAYTMGYSCPIPPMENHLNKAVEAGIKWNENHPKKAGK